MDWISFAWGMAAGGWCAVLVNWVSRRTLVREPLSSPAAAYRPGADRPTVTRRKAMKVTAVALSSESGDHYANVWEGHLTDEEIDFKILKEYGDEAEYIYVDEVVHKTT